MFFYNARLLTVKINQKKIPNPPSNVSINNPTETSLQVNFKDNADNEKSIHVERKIDNSSWGYLIGLQGDTRTGDFSWTNQNLTPQTTYCYRLYVENDAGKSAYSNESCGTTKDKSILPLTITTPSPLPEGEVGKSYTQSFGASGGQLPYVWPSYSGTLPVGITMYTKGTLSGTPTKEGTYTFTLTVSDSSNPKRTDSKAFTVKINGKKGKCIFGKTNCDFDVEINQYATPDIDGDLIKSVIHEESKFNPDAIRYEIHTDYNWYSRFNWNKPPERNWRGLNNLPEKHWRLGGHNVLNEQIIEGDQVKNMVTDIYSRMKRDTVLPKLNVTKGDTAQDVINKNPKRDWTYIPKDTNYTAQLILASSYGLMQLLYDTARWNGFENKTSPARHVEDLFKPEVNIKVGTNKLSFDYKNTVLKYPDWSQEQKIKETLRKYNGSGPDAIKYSEKVFERYQSNLYDKVK